MASPKIPDLADTVAKALAEARGYKWDLKAGQPFSEGLLLDARTAIAAYRAALHGWQPIETAPRGWGKMLLLYGRQESHTQKEAFHSMSAGDHIYVGCWSEGFGNKWVGGIFWPEGDTSPMRRWVELSPTHWMPLPDPPHADG